MTVGLDQRFTKKGLDNRFEIVHSRVLSTQNIEAEEIFVECQLIGCPIRRRGRERMTAYVATTTQMVDLGAESRLSGRSVRFVAWAHASRPFGAAPDAEGATGHRTRIDDIARVIMEQRGQQKWRRPRKDKGYGCRLWLSPEERTKRNDLAPHHILQMRGATPKPPRASLTNGTSATLASTRTARGT